MKLEVCTILPKNHVHKNIKPDKQVKYTERIDFQFFLVVFHQKVKVKIELLVTYKQS